MSPLFYAVGASDYILLAKLLLFSEFCKFFCIFIALPLEMIYIIKLRLFFLVMAVGC